MTKPAGSYDIAVIGAGPAGLMAAAQASRDGARVLLLEKGTSPGRKLLATGSGRCNLTHHGDVESFLEGFDRKRARFLKHAAWQFPPDAAMDYFEKRGIGLVVERGERVFPKSGKARDILDVLRKETASSGAHILTSSPVQNIEQAGRDDTASFCVTAAGKTHPAASVVIATGGCSMRRSGSTGDGYRLAEQLGHRIIPPRPSLVRLVCRESWPSALDGLVLKNVQLKARAAGKSYERFGELQCTADGIGGPIVLEMSRLVTDTLHDGNDPVSCTIDLKPALDHKKLDARLLREFDNHPGRSFRDMLLTLMPGRLADTFISSFGFDGGKEAGMVTRGERKQLRLLLKALPLTVTAAGPVEEALVTRGGIDIQEISPRTLASKLVPGLFFAGEVMDVDGDCGGYNLQMCWATGMLAGASAAAYCR